MNSLTSTVQAGVTEYKEVGKGSGLHPTVTQVYEKPQVYLEVEFCRVETNLCILQSHTDVKGLLCLQQLPCSSGGCAWDTCTEQE